MSDLILTDTSSHGVQALESALLRLPQVEVITDHEFQDGIYIRRITVPPYTVLTGAAHKTPYRVRLIEGSITVTTDEGVRYLKAPCEFDAPVGTQRAGYTLDDRAVWEDVYDNPDNCQDISVIEDRLYVVPECGMMATRTPEQWAQIDYQAFLHEIDSTEDDIQRLVTIDNVCDMTPGYCVELRPSLIHGIGLFATVDFDENDIICPALIDEHRTIAGRYMNHSSVPNITFEPCGNDLLAVAIRHIDEGDELTCDYRESLSISIRRLDKRG